MDGTTQDANLFEVIRVGGLATAVLVLAGTYVLVRFTTSALQGVGARWADKRLLINQVATLLRFVIWLVGLGIALALSVNLTREVLLALGGTAAVTIGFALKDLAASILAGVIIIVDRPFQVGDRVTFGTVYGEIASIGLRSVRLVTLEDVVVTIPNNKFLTDVVSSGNWGALDMTMQIEFFIGVDQDIALAERIVGDALTSCRYAYAKKPWDVFVNQVIHENVPALRLRARAHVIDVKYEREFETDLTKRVMAAFQKHRVLPPALLHRSLEAPGMPIPASSATLPS
ncbi:MAG: mechanosensitive ion channel [Labilithrix sp.]|nr:mechanosensitive ion channel [Labilithrix sp.]